MALDPVGVSSAVPTNQATTTPLRADAQVQVQESADQLQTAAQQAPLPAQAQAQSVAQTDELENNPNRDPARERREGRGEGLDIEA